MCWSLCQPMQEPCIAFLAGIQESCATGGSNIWSSSVCQGEGAICQAKQDFVVDRFVRRGRAFLREASSRCYLKCCWLELVRLLCRDSWGDFRSWLPSTFVKSRVAEKCWHWLGEQPGSARTDLVAVAKIFSGDSWCVGEENVCVLNKYWHSARAYQLIQCFSF